LAFKAIPECRTPEILGTFLRILGILGTLSILRTHFGHLSEYSCEFKAVPMKDSVPPYSTANVERVMRQQMGTDDEGEINRRLEALVDQQKDAAAGEIAVAVQRRRDAMRRAARAREGHRLTLVHFSAQPEPLSVTEATASVHFSAQPETWLPIKPPSISYKKCSVQADR